MQILNSLVPIFSIIGLGMLLRHQDFLNAESTRAFNRFAYFFGLPAFLFYKLAGAESISGSGNLMTVALFASVFLTFVVSWLTALAANVKIASRGASIQAGFRGNLAFMGIPLVMFLLDEATAAEKSSIEAAVLLALMPVIIFFNVGSVVALAAYNDKSEKNFSIAGTIVEIVRNPLIWACVAGALFQFLNWEVPTAIERTFSVVGASAFPIALLGIGSQLISIPSAKGWRSTVVPAINKCLLCPMIGWLIAASLGLTGVELQVCVILCAMPTAVSSYVLADQMGGNADLAAGTVVVSTVLSLPTLAILIWLT
jgi:predicted permease